MRYDPVVAAVRAARPHLPPKGEGLVVGFSGGPDSAALLHALVRLGHWRLVAVHIDHRMRIESMEGAQEAKRLAEGFGVSCRIVRLARRPTSEAAARDARHDALAHSARPAGATVIALGHNADDQLETMLLRITRGTGLTGLRAMAQAEAGPAGVLVSRPLLGVTRAKILAYLESNGVAAIEDPTNRDPAFADRNRIRIEAVPVLRVLNPRVTDAAARLARIAADDDDALDAWTDRAYQAATADSGDRSAIGLDDLESHPVAIRRRLVRRLAPDLTYRQVEQVLGLAARRSHGHTHLPDGRIMQCGQGRLMVGSGTPATGPLCRICLTQGGLLPSMERE